MNKEEAAKALIGMRGGNKVKKLSATTARTTIGMMRSIASHIPISPFHMMAADQMESLLEEVTAYRAVIDAQNIGSGQKGLKLRGEKKSDH